MTKIIVWVENAGHGGQEFQTKGTARVKEGSKGAQVV